MSVEIRSLLNKVTNEERDLKPVELASVLNSAGDMRAEALAIVNAHYGDEGTRVEALRALFAADRAEPGDRGAGDLEAMHRAKVARGEVRELPGIAAGNRTDELRENEQRNLVPSISEYRALVATTTPGEGGYAVPTKVAQDAIVKLRNASALLRIPGLNVIPFDGGDFTLPQITAWSDATVTAEKGAIAEGTQTFGGPKFHAVKYTDLRSVTNEHVADSAVDIQRLLSTEMTKGIAEKIDKDAFGTNTSSTAGLIGFETTGNSVKTTLTTGNVVVKWDDIIDAYVRVLTGNAVPTAVLAGVDMYGPLLKERAVANGNYLAGQVTDDPAKAALGLPLIPSNALPAKSVYVIAGDRVFLGMRQDVSVAMSGDALFAQDSLSIRATMRVAGLIAAEASSVQLVRASAT